MMQDKNIFDYKDTSRNRDTKLLVLQIIFYLGYIGLLFVLSGIYPVVFIIKLICIILSCAIKFYRQVKYCGWKQTLQLQLGFLVVYLLMGFELIFSYQYSSLIVSRALLACSFSTTIITIFNYSLFTNTRTITKIEFVIYSIGVICMMCLKVKGMIQTIEIFSEVQGGQYLEKFILLTASTMIAIGAKLLEKIYSSFKGSRGVVVGHQQQQQESKTKREEMQIQLIQTTRINN